MIVSVDLHFRSSPADEHRNLGVVEVEHGGPALEPYQEITYRAGDRQVRAQVTAIRARPEHLPHVYADGVEAEELVG